MRAADGGQTWTLLPTAGLTNLKVWTVTVCPSGVVLPEVGAEESTDLGEWLGAGRITACAQLFIASLACDGAGTLLAGTYNQGVYRSVNNGGNWVSGNSGLGDQRMLVLVTSDVGTTLAGTYSGAYISTSGGMSWAAAGLENQAVYDFAFDRRRRTAYLGGDRHGCLRVAPIAPASWARVGPATDVIYTVTLDGTGELYAGAQRTGAYNWTGSQWVAETLSGSVYCMRNAGVGRGG